MSLKIDRIASNIVKEISLILSQEIKDSHIKFVTVTDCKLAHDLGHAKIYVTVLDDNKKEETMLALKNASRFIRKELAQRIDVRHVPDLEFVYDESIEYGLKIENLIDKINDNWFFTKSKLYVKMYVVREISYNKKEIYLTLLC